MICQYPFHLFHLMLNICATCIPFVLSVKSDVLLIYLFNSKFNECERTYTIVNIAKISVGNRL